MKETEILLLQLRQAFNIRAWHGSNLIGSLRGMTPETALWRPGPDRHNIWELLVHCAYWKYMVMKRITGDTGNAFPHQGSNFFIRDTPDVNLLKADLKLLKSTHQQVLDLVAQLPVKDLNKVYKQSRFTYRDMILGIASHDLYHAGQIQLLKRLQEP